MQLRVDGDTGKLSTTTPQMTVEGDFVITIENAGAPTHVHLKVSDSIRSLVEFDGSNVYVDDETEIPVDVKPIEDDVAGTLTVTSSYGSESAQVGIVLESGEDPLGGVDVDESLGQPIRDDDVDAIGGSSDDGGTEITYTGFDYLIGALIGIPILVIVLWGVISGNLVVPVLAIMLAVLGGVFIWLFKHHPQTADPDFVEDEE